jgi:uroporphyrin-III C-methyltransferase/precorrin-2 dehydrogenase/sirohydrochlorin ferrochelatase
MSIAPSADRAYFAAFLDLRGKPGIVVGGGAVAALKAEALLRSGVRVTAVAPEFCARLSELAVLGALRLEAKRFQPGDVVGADIVVAATDDPAVNEAVSVAAKALRIPVNVADNAALSTFIMPSVVDRPPLQIAISSAGNSPVLARKLRTLIEGAVPFAFGRLAALIGRFRTPSKRRIPDPEARRRFWEDVVDGPIADRVLSGNESEAASLLQKRLEGAGKEQQTPVGFVSLVGAGPGDPELLTLRALRVMQGASVVLYDHLVSPRLVDLVRRDAERIYVGKEQDRHALPQERINALMVELALAGKRVVRLKGGDPFIFGRGGEEIEALAEHGIAFEVVPGITAASGASTYAGIPLTHRDYAQCCVFVTGHLKNGAPQLDWGTLVRPRQTIAVYMGVGALAGICSGLVGHGMRADMPAAVVEKATLSSQRVVEGTVATLPRLAQDAGIQPPALLIVGEVVSLRRKLAWFDREEKRFQEPFSGKRFLEPFSQGPLAGTPAQSLEKGS